MEKLTEEVAEGSIDFEEAKKSIISQYEQKYLVAEENIDLLINHFLEDVDSDTESMRNFE